jgi:hypothetical protein
MIQGEKPGDKLPAKMTEPLDALLGWKQKTPPWGGVCQEPMRV